MHLVVERVPADPDFAMVLVDASIAGRPYRLLLDTGAARSRLPADEYTSALPVVGEDVSAAAFGRPVIEPVVTITDLAVGPLRLAALNVTRAEQAMPVLGMDVLGRHCCHFQLAARILQLGRPPGIQAGREFLRGPRGHVYVDARWPGVTARACWDTGAGATIVDRAFWLRHPELFAQIATSQGTDAHGGEADTPVLLMTGPVIGQHEFRAHKAVAANLSAVNATLEYPMDLILGYPTINQASWLFDSRPVAGPLQPSHPERSIRRSAWPILLRPWPMVRYISSRSSARPEPPKPTHLPVSAH